MAKFMYMADSHISEQSPVHRKDNFLAAQERKIRKVFELASDHKVEAILHGGDLFHHHQASYWFAHWVITLLKELMQKHHQGPIIVNQGNHDVLGGRLPTTYEGVLGAMADAGVVELLTTNSTFEDRTLFGVDFRFIPYRLNQDLSVYNTDRIIINHDMVTTYDTPFDHLLCSTISQNTRSPLVLCSHWHSQFKRWEGSTLFANPGPMMRRSWSERNVKPGVAIVDTSQFFSSTMEPGPVTFHSLEAGDDVFRVPENKEGQDALYKVEQAYEVAEEFVRTLKVSVETMSVDEIVRSLASELHTTQAALTYALEKLQQARAMEIGNAK